MVRGEQKVQRGIVLAQRIAVHPRADFVVRHLDFVVDAIIFVKQHDRVIGRKRHVAFVLERERHAPAIADFLVRFQICHRRKRKRIHIRLWLAQEARNQRSARDCDADENRDQQPNSMLFGLWRGQFFRFGRGCFGRLLGGCIFIGKEIIVEQLGKEPDGVEIGHDFAAFPAGNGRSGHIHPFGELFLRDIALFADGIELFGEGLH